VGISEDFGMRVRVGEIELEEYLILLLLSLTRFRIYCKIYYPFYLGPVRFKITDFRKPDVI
jgi:hypothetical protein